eukprot:COSAG02_NODE_3198_length_7186_cov_9.288557_3_plen_46_part_00
MAVVTSQCVYTYATFNCVTNHLWSIIDPPVVALTLASYDYSKAPL